MTALIYEITRKSPGTLRPGTLKAAVHQAMKTLGRAEVQKVVEIVATNPDVRRQQRRRYPSAATRLRRTTEQVRWYLWKFEQQGVLLRLPDRRYPLRATPPL